MSRSSAVFRSALLSSHAFVSGLFAQCLLLVLCALFLLACSPDERSADVAQVEPVNLGMQSPEWTVHLAEHSAGLVSRHDSVRLVFSHDIVTQDRVGRSAASQLSSEPKLAGETRFLSAREIQFTPSEPLPGNREIIFTLSSEGLIDLPADLPPYRFSLRAMPRDFELVSVGLETQESSTGNMVLRGTIETSDGEAAEDVEKLLVAKLTGQALTLDWAHYNKGRTHYFSATDIPRGEQRNRIELTWSGNSIGSMRKGQQTLEIPAKASFEVLGAQVVRGAKSSVVIHFSDALAPSQDLKGLVSLEGASGSTRTRVEGNRLKLYPDPVPVGKEVTLRVMPGVRNAIGKRLKDVFETRLSFANENPQVRFVGKSVILPNNPVLSVPFEAMNVHSVDVTAFRIHADNMGQFLQANALSGSNELNRVGRYLWRRTVHLDQPSTDRWTRHALDVSALLKDHPGAMFRLSLSINRGQSLYACSDAEREVPIKPQSLDRNSEDYYETEGSGWDGLETYYQQQSSGERMRWRDRHNPCMDAYFAWGDQVSDSRNFLASNFGLTAKRGQGGDVHVIVTALDSAQPMKDVALELQNFQGQTLATGRSDAQGFARLATPKTAFLLLARQGGQIGYLKLNPGEALPTSHFDTGGETVKAGIKGFIYGERGVWRPGDDIHLNFVLADAGAELPAGHPVTMQLFDPRGRLVQTLNQREPVGRFYRFDLKTAPTDPTGTWTATALVGGAEFSKRLKIETVMPNRLRAELSFADKAITVGEKASAKLFAQWLHGATASSLKADVLARLVPVKTGFTRARDFQFDDPTRRIESEPAPVFEGHLDEQGHAAFDLTMKPSSAAPGALRALLTTRVFEPGGAFSTVSSAQPFHAYSRYVGIKLPKGDVARSMLLTDTDHEVQLATLDRHGEPVSVRDLEVNVYKIEWKWWWDRSGNELADFAEKKYPLVVRNLKASTQDGRGSFKFRIDHPEWGRYLLRVCDVQGGHCTAQTMYIDWPGWAGGAQDDKGPGASVLAFSSDKKKYAVGETAVLQLPPATQGRALLTLETGSRLIDQRWLQLDKTKSRVEIPITAAMAPSVYASISLLQPHAGKDNDRPIRLYGVIPLEVSDPQTVLEPQISSAELWRPNREVSFKVSEQQGRAMTYTVAVVDEGLLGLTNFKTPNPHQHFYRREALGVRTWDLFDEVAGAYGQALDQLLAIGGDSGGPITQRDEESRFPPVVRVLGPFRLNAGETVKHKVDLPQYAGQVRVMLVAGSDKAYGHAEKPMTVRDPLTVLATLPRVLGPDEQFRLPISVFAFEPEVRDVQLKLSASDSLKIIGDSKIALHFDAPGEKLAFVDMQVADAIGKATVRVDAESAGHKTHTEIHIPIRSPSPVSSRFVTHQLAPGEIWTTPLKPFGVEGTRAASLSLSSTPPFGLERRLDYLVRYPHGCIEQTVSAAFPQLFLGSFMQMQDGAAREVERNVSVAIARLDSFQRADGSYAYWPGLSDADLWSTNYAGHFLAHAKRLGYAVSPSQFNRWLEFQKTAARSDRNGGLLQAYRLLTLAVADHPDLGAMNRLRESGLLDEATAVTLSAAYARAGLLDAARSLLMQAGAPRQYREPGESYGSATRDEALNLLAQVLAGRRNEADRMAARLAEQLSSDQWFSTHTTAWSMLALAAYAGEDAASQPFRVQLGGGESKAEEHVSEQPMMQLDLTSALANGGQRISLNNTSAVPVYARVQVDGSERDTESEARSEGLQLHLYYATLAGEPLDPVTLKQGTDVVAHVSLSNLSARNLDDLALTFAVPSGWEIHNARLGEDDKASLPKGKASPLIHQDIRDDRVLSYLSLKKGESHQLKILLNASYAGRWYQPGVVAESMYDGSKQAKTVGRWVDVLAQ